MKKKSLAIAALILSSLSPLLSADEHTNDAVWRAVHDNSHRTQDDKQRDRYRHPEAVLKFFNIQNNSVVAEVAPGTGWYTRILAPLVKDEGKYIGLNHDPDFYAKRFPDNKEWADRLRSYPERLKEEPELYGSKAVGSWIPITGKLPVEQASVDVVFISRTLHNWQNQGRIEEGLQQSWQILKPKGVLAIVQHRMADSYKGTREDAAKKGRFVESDLIALVEEQGFKLVEKSEINANPKDTADYEKGVWTLPPSLAMKDENRTHYLEIGESDRMTLKFVKIKA
ncbi:class I SAM-dependent methyltransferase [Alteromonas sp. ASW11-130]|uniref:class I SAM-dependent methyltransferase n=1 Tax=Alteromonas sp. ASW11-130 TaxID=3015775 RepID=UPI002241F0CC|nr:methyltransferase domain-containing protein [Alteromonas sp. ASW11-130]MCW8091501.1 methyltransferase domain-containing protein [Alteromonas sp. ASW11-130]